MDALRRLTRRLCGAARGIVALDTPAPEVARRLRVAGVRTTEPAAQAYLSMLLRTPTLALHAGGVVLPPDELDGRADSLRLAGIVAGVRVDTGDEPGIAAGHRVTSGLDGLAERLDRYREVGAQFGVWSVCTAALPGDLATLTVNSQSAARFAMTCQNAGLVPVVRIGSRMSSAGPRAQWGALAAAVLSVVGHLEDLGVDLDRLVLNAVCPAAASVGPQWGSPLSVLPARVGGVALSAGPVDHASAAATLRAVAGPAPWPVTFFVGREATFPAMRAWRGRAASVPAGQDAFVRELKRVAARLPESGGVTVLPSRREPLAPGRR